MTDDTGMRFGRYTAERLLGSGAFATVWLARDEALDAPVAVKVLAENWAHDDDVRRRFAEEARILRRLESDHIVRIYDVSELPDGRPYFVMEYADRPDLAGRIAERVQAQSGQFTVDEAVAISLGIADALAVAHALDVVHRDLKPSNVLFRSVGSHLGGARDERMMLADFGIARSLLSGRSTTIAAGTPFYMAPEQSEGRSDKRSDVYAAAAILYELLSGRVPYPHDSIGALLRAQYTSDPERLDTLRDDVAPALADVVARGLAREPDDRYDDAAAWAAALRSAQSTESGAAPSAGPPETVRSMAETRIGAGATAAVAAGAGAAVGASASSAAGAAAAAGPPTGPPNAGAPTGPPTSSAGGGATAGPPPRSGGGGANGAGGDGARNTKRLVAIGVIVALVAGIGGIALATRDSGKKEASSTGGDAANAYRILLERARTAGPNPFMPTLVDQKVKIPEVPVNLPGAPVFPVPSTSQAVQSGAVPGLYGGTRQISVCDAKQMLTFLRSNAVKAAAWARVQGIAPSAITDFVGALTPLVLRSDTTVLNHGFANGQATPRVSVLQAGTAVLVDKLGVPRTKCFCGNPLLGVAKIPLPGVGDRTVYVGDKWPTFDPREVIGIVNAAAPVTKFVIVDVINKTVFARPVGTTGSNDEPASLPGQPTTTTKAPATTTPPTSPPTQLVDISNTGTPYASSVTPGTNFTEDLALDNNRATSWFSAGDAEGQNSTFMWTTTGDRGITTIELVGNGANSNPSFRSGYGFASATIVVQNLAGATVFSQDVNFGPSMDPNVTVRPNTVGVKIIITLHDHQSPDCGGFSELIVRA